MTGNYKRLEPTANEQLLIERKEELLNEAFIEFFEKVSPLLEGMNEAQLDMMAQNVESALAMTHHPYRAEDEVFEYPKELSKRAEKLLTQTALQDVELDTSRVEQTPHRHVAFTGISGVPC